MNQFKYCLIGTLKLNVILLLLFNGCTYADVEKSKKEEKVIDVEKDIKLEESSNGESYSEAMIKELSKTVESLKIDTTLELHSFDKSKFKLEHCNDFTINMLKELDVNGKHIEGKKAVQYPKVSMSQNSLLGVTEYLCDKTFNKNHSLYIFHSSEVESHYSNSIHLIAISNETNKFNSLVLCQQYLSESYEYDITSRFVSKNEIEVVKQEKYNMSNSSSTDDSISVTRTNYFISDEGNIELK